MFIYLISLFTNNEKRKIFNFSNINDKSLITEVQGIDENSKLVKASY